MNKAKDFEQGFLDKEMVNIVNNVKKKYAECYEYIYKYNRLAYKVINKLQMTSVDTVKTYILTVFVEIHNSYQSYILLLEHGAYEDSQIVLRSIYDKLFSLSFVIKDNSNLKYLYQNYVKEKLNTFKIIKKFNCFDLITMKDNDAVIKKYENMLLKDNNEKELKMYSTKKMAEELNMKEIYCHYRILSDYTHNDFMIVNDKITYENSNVIIDGGLNYKNFEVEVSKAVFCLEYIMKSICSCFKLDQINEELRELKN